MKHVNPYRINDPDCIFEVGANSSHPDLQDADRIWKFGAYTFRSAEAIEKFFSDEGLNPRNYVREPVMERNVIQGKNRIIIHIVEKWKSRQSKRLKEMSIGNST